MRKWLYLLLALVVVQALSKLKQNTGRKEYPRLKRIDRAITIFVWVLAGIYLISIVYWFFGPSSR
jgi:hypothetical protein